MTLLKNECITPSGLRICMPMPGVLRLTDGNHPHSYAVCAKTRRLAPKVEGNRLIWGKIALDPEQDMALYYNGKLLFSDYIGPRKTLTSVSPEEQALLAAEGHVPSEALAGDALWPIEVAKTLPADAAIYGLGDKTGFLNKRGYAYENWNTDDPSPHVDNFKSLYKSINFFLVKTANGVCGIFADNTYRTRFDFGKENPGYFYFSHAGGALDYYLIPGKDLKEVLRLYARLTGSSMLQQKWVYGYHQSHWSYYTSNEVRTVAKAMRDNRIPIDCIHMDIDYMDGFRVFTFQPERFGDFRSLTRELEQNHIKPVAIIDPGVKLDPGYRIYDEGEAQGHFAKNPNGTTYVGEVWPGKAVFPDFSRSETRQWWAQQIQDMVHAGVRGIWNDMNEPANFTGQLPDDVQFHDGNHLAMHNVYGHLMAQATYDGLLQADGKRPFVLTRACFAGSQRFCSGWTGDNHSLWTHIQLSLVQMMNLGLSGMYMTGSDVGGFGSDCTPELLIRWTQAGCLSPFFRNHYAKGTRNQEPYAFDEATTDACRKAIDLRYHLLPYLYDLAHEDLPMLRPLVLEYPDDPQVANISDQYLIGDKLLVAPVLNPGVSARAVYLPKGTWYDYYTGKRYSGGRYILAQAPLDCLPLFAKAGSIFPVSVGTPQSTDDICQIQLEVFPGTGSFTHYTDDGETMAYADGAIHRLKITVRGSQVTQQVVQNGFEAPSELPVVFKA